MSYLLALDAGTGSIRAVIFDLNGRQLAVGQAEWKHLSVDNVPGSMEFDLTTNWQLACQCIRQALDAARLSAADIQSVACCSMREGIVLYDRNGEAIWACANVDARASREVAELKEIHDDRFESEVYDISGQTLALSAMPRLWPVRPVWTSWTARCLRLPTARPSPPPSPSWRRCRAPTATPGWTLPS